MIINITMTLENPIFIFSSGGILIFRKESWIFSKSKHTYNRVKNYIDLFILVNNKLVYEILNKIFINNIK